MSEVVQPVLLAAGRSSRFGNDKLLAKVQLNGINQPVLLHTLQRWLTVVSELTLVIRPDNLAIKALLDAKANDFAAVNVVEAIDADKGMGHSLAAGINATSQAKGWLVGLADMPLIPAQVLQTSLQLLQQGALLTAPFYLDQRGHPVGFSAHFRQQLLRLQGDNGAKAILMANKENMTPIFVSDNGVCQDVDTLRDLIALQQWDARINKE